MNGTLLKLAAIGLIMALPVGAFLLGDNRGYERAQADADRRAIERLQERGMINEEIADLDACELLRELGGECLSDSSGD